MTKKSSFVKWIIKKKILFEGINKNLLIKVLKRTKSIAGLRSKCDDKIVIKFIAYK